MAIRAWDQNLLKSTIEAVGRPEQATRSCIYTLTGKVKTDVDFNPTTYAYSPCCDRLKDAMPVRPQRMQRKTQAHQRAGSWAARRPTSEETDRQRVFP